MNSFCKIQSLETIEEVNHLFTNLFREIAEIIGAQKSTRYAELVDQVKRYVGEHYGKIDLSIQEIAESMDMSGAYLGRIFKQHTQMAFTEYLTRYRLKVACEELLGSEKRSMRFQTASALPIAPIFTWCLKSI